MEDEELRMPEISVVVPVYNAEKTLRRCVESILFGEEHNLEVILLEDCSTDGSWALCQTLAEEYPQVVCLQNDRNRGVSYTRNRGLDSATGQYLLFVDSDDWVRGSYVKTLITAAKENPGKLVACGFTFVDHTKSEQRYYGITDTTLLTRQEFHRLSGAVMLQQLWNKVFYPEQIRKAGIRFDETISMGEDYRFVMDVIETLDYRECVVIQEPLYYYIRWGNGSLMDQWFKYETYEDALERAMRVENLCGVDQSRLAVFKQGYAYRVIWETPLSGKQKRATVQKILGKEQGTRFYRRQRLAFLWSKVRKGARTLLKWKRKFTGKFNVLANRMKVRKTVKRFHKQELTVISQNCIGGVLSHDLKLPFCSPTVNLFIPAADFIRFVNNLEHYLNAELKVMWGKEYPLGMVEDVHIHFVHYDNCRQALEAWERRRKRADLSKVLVLSTDRDGFDETLFEQWKAITYPKMLFTACKQYADHEDVLYFPKYEKQGCVPDLIPKREFYKGNVLIKKINTMR